MSVILLTEQQMKELERREVVPPRLANPRTNEVFVLPSIEEYERLKVREYDDTSWTLEELQTLAW